MTVTLLQGDCVEVLPTIQEGSIQTCVTSPPYYGLRDYGVDGQIGLEQTPEEYIARLVEVFRGVWRVLKDDGTLWLNLGDSYAGSGVNDGSKNPGLSNSANRGDVKTKTRANTNVIGAKPKDLLGIPWRVALALQADGWYLRSDIIWHKPNPMPESVRDRPTKAHEYIFLMSKSQKYYYDADAVRELSKGDSGWEKQRRNGSGHPIGGKTPDDSLLRNDIGRTGEPSYFRNRRSVWTVTTKPYKGAHFATFPPALIEPCILAGSAKGDTVLDPFNGSGTTGAVAVKHGRNYIGIELNAEYIELTNKRLDSVQLMELACP